MSVSLVSRIGLFALAVSAVLVLGTDRVDAKTLCDKTVCSATANEAMSLAARTCGWSADFARADCKCLNAGGHCGKTPQGRPKTYRRCKCSVGTRRTPTPVEAKPSSCFERVKKTHASDGKLAAQVAALKCVGLPVKPERLKTLLGPKPGTVVLVMSPSFAERDTIKTLLNGRATLDVIAGVVRIEIDPHIKRLKVRSNGRGFTLTELLISRP